jgi:hypothetical protein
MGRNTLPILFLFRRQRKLERRVTELEKSYKELSARVLSLNLRTRSGAQHEYNRLRTAQLGAVAASGVDFTATVVRGYRKPPCITWPRALSVIAFVLIIIALNVFFAGGFHGLA